MRSRICGLTSSTCLVVSSPSDDYPGAANLLQRSLVSFLHSSTVFSQTTFRPPSPHPSKPEDLIPSVPRPKKLSSRRLTFRPPLASPRSDSGDLKRPRDPPPQLPRRTSQPIPTPPRPESPSASPPSRSESPLSTPTRRPFDLRPVPAATPPSTSLISSRPTTRPLPGGCEMSGPSRS